MKNLLIITALLSLFSFGVYAQDVETPAGADQCSSERVAEDTSVPQVESDKPNTGAKGEQK